MTCVAPCSHISTDTGELVSGHYTCDNCEFPGLGMAVMSPGWSAVSPEAWLDSQTDGVLWYPRRGDSREFLDVPQEIAAAASEAYVCRSVQAQRGAVLLARSVVEATAKSKGITEGTLADKIDAMFEARLIREHVRDGAHEVRYLGNDMAHGDFVDAVTVEDAELVLTLMSGVLDEVFQSQARVVKARQARAGRVHSDDA